MQLVLMAGLGGALGSMARYLCHRWIMQLFPGAFPWGTFAVNVVGCFLIGLFFVWYSRGIITQESTRLLLMTGICGGFTTFSAFTLEGLGLLRDERIGLFLLYIGSSVVIGLAATWLGWWIGQFR